jgi:hypothetical protein
MKEESFMNNLVNAKKVMNKLDNKEINDVPLNNISQYQKSLNENMIQKNDDIEQYNQNANLTPPIVDVEKVKNSRLPDPIKKLMIENPIQQVSLNDSLDMSFLDGAKKLMEREGLSKPTIPQQPSKNMNKKSIVESTGNLDMGAISLMIENAVRKVMDEKLNQILTAQETKSINENLVLRVGDSIFKGKITGVNKK